MNTNQNDAKLVTNHLNQLISGDPGPAGTRARRIPIVTTHDWEIPPQTNGESVEMAITRIEFFNFHVLGF